MFHHMCLPTANTRQKFKKEMKVKVVAVTAEAGAPEAPMMHSRMSLFLSS